jgi:hypothetical protein
MSADESLIDQDEGSPQSWNLYTYVRNNPVRNTDPTGNTCVGDGKDGFNDDGGPGQSCKDAAQLRIYRPPAFKADLGKVQANLEQKVAAGARPVSNFHLDINAFDNLIWPTFDTFIWPTLRPLFSFASGGCYFRGPGGSGVLRSGFQDRV